MSLGKKLSAKSEIYDLLKQINARMDEQKIPKEGRTVVMHQLTMDKLGLQIGDIIEGVEIRSEL